jgi:hypothetical protein
MLSLQARRQINDLLRSMAETTSSDVALLNPSNQVEVSTGEVEPYLGCAVGTSGSFLQELGGRYAYVNRLPSGFVLLVVPKSEDRLGEAIGASNRVRDQLEALVSGDPWEPPPARSAAMKVVR